MFLVSPNGLPWGAVFSALLLAGCVSDVRARRIPNPLVFAILASGLCYAVVTRPFTVALSYSIGGLLLGFVIWIVFHIAGVLGAGDVKFFAAAGAWLGPAATWRAALVAALVGGALAVVFLVRERRFARTVRKMALAASARSGALLLHSPDGGTQPGKPLPYGVALAIGALAAAWVPHLLG